MGIIVLQAIPFAVKGIACETKGITFANNQSEVRQKCEKDYQNIRCGTVSGSLRHP